MQDQLYCLSSHTIQYSSTGERLMAYVSQVFMQANDGSKSECIEEAMN